MGRVVRLKNSGEILGANQGEVIDKGRLNTAGGYVEGRVMDSLKFMNKGWLGVGEPNGSCIHENGPGKRQIGDKYGFLQLTPVITSKGREDVDTG